MVTQELLDACDIVYEVMKSGKPDTPSNWYTLGYVSSVQGGESRPMTRRGEVGSNATVLLIDEPQRSLTLSRLNVARNSGNAPHNKNLLALYKWVVTDGSSREKIIIDLDDPAFNIPVDIRKTYYSVARESEGTGDPVAITTYRRVRLHQYNQSIAAASKYLDDTVSASWEDTEKADMGG